MNEKSKKILTSIVLGTFIATSMTPVYAAENTNIAVTQQDDITCENLYFRETADGYEELNLIGDTYYYRMTDSSKTYVVAENNVTRETVIFDKANPDTILVNCTELSKTRNLNTSVSPDRYRSLLDNTVLNTLSFETKSTGLTAADNMQTRAASTLDAAINQELSEIGENANGYAYKTIYTTTINGTKVDLKEKMTYDKSKDVTSTQSIGTKLSVVLGIFTNASPNNLLGIAQWTLTVNGVYELTKPATFYEYGVFQRTTRDARINGTSYYDATRTRKWYAHVGYTNNMYSASLADAYTNYTSTTFNDQYAMCKRAADYYNG